MLVYASYLVHWKMAKNQRNKGHSVSGELETSRETPLFGLATGSLQVSSDVL